MRPPEFTGGNRSIQSHFRHQRIASMRPPEFTGGNEDNGYPYDLHECGFNEAAGIHRRKLRHSDELHRIVAASMRPPEFTGGNPASSGTQTMAMGSLQ